MASSKADEEEFSEDDNGENSSHSSQSKTSRKSSRVSTGTAARVVRRPSDGTESLSASTSSQLPPPQQQEEKMNIKSLLKCLSQTMLDDGFLDLDNYISAYRELDKFFNMMGSIFSFVSKDVNAKIVILEDYRASSKGERYKTINSMIEYEKKNNFFQQKSNTSVNGCRTLLRLHRALEFIKIFLQRLSHAREDEKVSTCAQEAYNSTLAKYHPWLIQKAAIVAMYSLPQKPELIRRTCVQNLQEATALLPSVVTEIGIVYDCTQTLYKTNGLLDLP